MKDLSGFMKERERLLAMNQPKDYKNASDEIILQVFEHFKNLLHEGGKTFDEEFYGGITNNIPKNLRRHNIENYIVCVEVDSFDTAKRIEGLLHSKLGFYIGENEDSSAGRGGKPDSTIVYMAQRDTPGFKD